MAKLPYVEDNEVNRDMLSRRLQRRGYEVLITVDGEQGIAQATAEKPDLILMDMSLPVVDGWEATRRLKGAPEARGIPIIGLTAHTHGHRPGQVPRGGLRRLRHQAGRARTAYRQDRASARDRRGPGLMSELERQRRARLANMRQELLAPVTALVGYAEMLIEKARGPGSSGRRATCVTRA